MAAFALTGIGGAKGQLDGTGAEAEVGKQGKGEFWLNGKNRNYCP